MVVGRGRSRTGLEDHPEGTENVTPAWPSHDVDRNDRSASQHLAMSALMMKPAHTERTPGTPRPPPSAGRPTI